MARLKRFEINFRTSDGQKYSKKVTAKSMTEIVVRMSNLVHIISVKQIPQIQSNKF